MLRIPGFALAALLALPLAAAPPATVIVVRHAERAGGMANDVGLSEAGRCRAGVLANMLAGAHVERIYTSEVARTQQTAEPLARKLNVTPQVVPAKDIDALVVKLRAGSGTALVVGHSNTVPEIVEKLGGGRVAPIADTEFDGMYIVTLAGPKEATLLMLRYPGCDR